MKTKHALLLLLVCICSAFRVDHPAITVYMIGDSTMANKDTTGGNPERGWGMAFSTLFTEEVGVENHAVNGRSSKSFIDEGRWQRVIERVKRGDYVFIQFGHNDEKKDTARHTTPGTTFDANLRRFVDETRAKGAIPVLLNSIARRNFEGDTLRDTHGEYLDSPRRVAQQTQTPFIDINHATHHLIQRMGREESKQLFMWVKPNTVAALPKGREDNTHLNGRGAYVVAGLVADSLHRTLPELAKHIRPRADAQPAPVAYEIEKEYPLYLDRLQQELTYPMAWGHTTHTNYLSWQQAARTCVFDALLTAPTPAAQPRMEVVATLRRQGYEARKIRFNLTDYARVPAYLLVPDGKGPFPAVVLLHDHGAHFSIGKEKMVRPFEVDSLVSADADQWVQQCYDGQYVGDYLAANGYVVIAIDALFWGERGRKEGSRYESQQALACVFEMLGRSWSGTITHEDLYTTQFLATLPEVDASRIGCMGFSMGAYRAWMLAALSPQIRAGAAVCWMTTTDHQLSSTHTRGKGDSNFANTLPGLRRYLDYPHIASIACPKPMLFFNGRSDKLFPTAAVNHAYTQMRAVWQSQNANQQLVTKLWDAPHCCHREMQQEVLTFFHRTLSK